MKAYISDAMYTIFHPFNGFWSLKYEKKGKTFVANCLYLLLLVTTMIRSGSTGFIVKDNTVSALNVIKELFSVILPVILWCTANWSTTTLMNGKGSFRDIYIALAYSLIPFILFQIPLTLLSNVITEDELMYHTFFCAVQILWTGFLILISTMTIHEYTFYKTIVTILLTLIVAVIILILAVVFIALLQQSFNFFYQVYQEIIFRV